MLAQAPCYWRCNLSSAISNSVATTGQGCTMAAGQTLTINGQGGTIAAPEKLILDSRLGPLSAGGASGTTYAVNLDSASAAGVVSSIEIEAPTTGPNNATLGALQATLTRLYAQRRFPFIG